MKKRMSVVWVVMALFVGLYSSNVCADLRTEQTNSVLLASPISSGAVSDGAVSDIVSQSIPEQNTKTNINDVDQGLQYQISEDMGHDNRSFHLKKQGDVFTSDNPSLGLKVDIGSKGMQVFQGAYHFGLGLSAVKQGNTHIRYRREMGKADVRANRLTLSDSRIKEWYVNGPYGIQQGWTIAHRLSSNQNKMLTMELASYGNLGISIEQDGQGIALSDAAGNTVMHYRGLYAYDASKKKLQAWFEKQGGQVLIRVADKGASYPITIDPWVQLVQFAKLTASDGVTGDSLGYYFSVAISSDGGTVAAGAYKADVGGIVDAGAAYVYVKPATGWATATQTAKLTASDKAASDNFGSSVAISPDGETVVVGAYMADVGGTADAGAVYVFVKPLVGGWINATENAKLTAGDKSVQSCLGWSAAVTDDGTVAAGACYVPPGTASFSFSKKAVYVFEKPLGGWTGSLTQTAKLTASDEAANDYALGWSVGISSNSTVVAGAIKANTAEGAVYVYVKPESGWATTTTQSAILTASNKVVDDELGYSVAISSDGSTVAAGASGADPGAVSAAGSVFVFEKPGGDWATATQTAILTASDKTGSATLGFSVAVSSGGGIVVAGAKGAVVSSVTAGSVYAYEKPESGWANNTETQKLSASPPVASDRLGWSLAISSDGGTVVAGAPNYTNTPGAAYVFAPPFAPQLTTQAASSIADTTATGNGTITATGGVDVTGRGFCWSTSANPTTSDSKTTSTPGPYGTGAFTDGITGLTKDTTYHIRAYATNSVGTGYGEDVTFTTLVEEPTTQASNITFSSVTDTTFTINWTPGNGAKRIVVVKSGSAVDSHPVDNTTYTANTVFGSGTQIGTGNYVVYSNSGASVAVTSLTAGTTYHVAVYEYNGAAGTENYNTAAAAGNPANQSTTTPTPGPVPGPGPDPPYVPPCSLSISSFNPSVTGDSGTTTFGVSNAVNYTNVSWTASVQQGGDWFTITSGASGTDSGTITCAFTANPSTAVARVAYIGIVPSDGLCQGRLGIMVTQNPLSVSATLLWTKTDGTAWVWPLDATGLQMGYGRTYGPLTGWTADSFHREAGSDGTAQMLWNHVNGKASVQFMNDMGDVVSMEYGPEAGWTAVSYHLNSNGTAQMLWNHTDGTASVWTLDVRGNITSRILYGPYPDSVGIWIAKDYRQYSDGTANMLWVRTDAYTSVWTLNSTGNMTSRVRYGPFTDETSTYLWYAKSYLRNSDGTANMLWSRNGHASVWTLDCNGNMTGRVHYGPNLGWTPRNFDKIN